MDYLKKLEFLQRYSRFNFSRFNFSKLTHNDRLIYTISVVQFVAAVLLFFWFLYPRLDTYLTAKPKGFLARSFSQNSRYLIAKADIVGDSNASPSGYMKVILKEPKIILRAKANKKGQWLVKIPEKIPEKNYQMQIISFDSKGKNPKVKLVKVRIESNNAIYQSKIYKKLYGWYFLTQRQLSKFKLA